MLNRKIELATPEKMISDNLTHKPSASNSIWNNFAMGAATVPYMLNSFNKEYNESPRGQHVKSAFEAIKRGNENPEVGWLQWGANEVSNMVGQATNPLTWVLVEGGGMAMKPIISGVGAMMPKAISALTRKPLAELMSEPFAKYFPKVIGKESDTLSMGLFGKKWAEGFGIGAGASLPQATVDNFNAETNKHDILGIATGMGAGGIFGMAIATIPFAWGIGKANFNRLRGKPESAPIEPGAIDKAHAEGQIDKETFDTLKDLEEYQKNPESRPELKAKLSLKANQYAESQGHTVDHANDTANFEILNKEQISNLQSATADQLVSDNIPEQHRNALTDFAVQAGIDDVRGKTNLLDGVRGYVEYASENLANKDKVLKEADKLVDESFKLQKLFRGYTSEKNYPYPSESVLFNDFEFGKGYWFGETKEHVKKYGNKIHEVEGDFNLLDTGNIKDKELKKLWDDIQDEINLVRKKGHGARRKELHEYAIKKFREKVKEKGYQGLKRKEGELDHYAGRTEIMLFEKPESQSQMPFDQQHIYETIKNNNLENPPFSVPESVAKKLKDEGEPLLSPMEELNDIKNKLITKDGLPKKYQSLPEYQRLQDLAEVWQPAKTLLDRVLLEEEINRQAAYRDLAKSMLDIADANVGKMADQEKVKGYLEERTNPKIDKDRKPKMTEEQANKITEVPEDVEAIFAEQDRLMEESESHLNKHEYELAKEKFNEFKMSEMIFNNLIKCQLGKTP